MAIKYTDFLPYEVLTAAQVQSLQDSVVVQVDTIAELDDLESTVNAAYCLEDNNLYIHDGSAWAIMATQDHVASQIDAAGTYQDWTPTLSGDATAPTNWVGVGRYVRIGDHVHGWAELSNNGTATAGTSTAYSLSLPVVPAGTNPRMGSGELYIPTGTALSWVPFRVTKASTGSFAHGIISSMATSMGAGGDTGSLHYTTYNALNSAGASAPTLTAFSGAANKAAVGMSVLQYLNAGYFSFSGGPGLITGTKIFYEFSYEAA